MNNSYINVYKDNPTAGATDGVLVSEGGSMTEPIAVTLDASQNQSQTIKLAVRCQTGYQTDGVTTIEDNNDSSDRWKLGLSSAGGFADYITISAVSSVNSVFWAQVSSDSTESPTNDTSVALKITAPIAPV